MLELFSKSQLWGTFKGFSDRGFEFAADIVTPYNNNMQDRPQLGQFLLVQLGTPEEASLGRITKFIPTGMLTTAEGEDYIITMQERDQEVPEDLKTAKLKYRVQIKLLGAVKIVNEKIIYIPSQRRLPHLGAKVALPSDAVLRELCQLSGGETDLGDYVLGEFVYSGEISNPESIFRHINPPLKVTFDISNLVSKRTVVFARAGYGKSNLIKYLTGELYRNGIPKTHKETERNVGVLIFDADGEYFWPDFKGRPGLCDVEQLQKNLVVFTSRIAHNQYYESWKAGNVKIDIRSLPAKDVISIAISADRQNQQNVLKLKSLGDLNWSNLVDLIADKGLNADEKEIGNLLGYNEKDVKTSSAEIAAAKSNMYFVVNHLHDSKSQFIADAMDSLMKGYCVVVDISLLSSSAGYNIAGLLMRKIFNHNQFNFTTGAPIPVIAVIEEAQSVLGKRLEESSPFVEWVKEGRKYDLGAILITQQPGSMSPELLSQADNWFSFHLLSEGDAGALCKYNSHFSNDILAHLIGEPIQGNCYMWSAPRQPFVLPVRIRNFEELYSRNVKKEPDAKPFSESAAKEINKKVKNRNIQLAQELKARIKKSKTLKLKSFDNDISGIHYGRLYYYLKEIKQLETFKDEYRSENELKLVVLKEMLGCDVNIQEETEKDGLVKYYCAPKSNWEKII